MHVLKFLSSDDGVQMVTGNGSEVTGCVKV